MFKRGKRSEEERVLVSLFAPPIAVYLIASLIGVRTQAAILLAVVTFCIMLGYLYDQKRKAKAKQDK